MTAATPTLTAEDKSGHERFLFAACFVALIATAVAFVIRGFVIGQLGAEFGLSKTQQGEIIGAGFWPFGLSIVVFSLFIDKVGYGKSMIFAFVCHTASVFLTIFASGENAYWMLYFGACLCGLAAGTVEAVINPAVATMYPKSKTKMLSVLHAGWPGGIVLGGIIVLLLGDKTTLQLGQTLIGNWQIKVGVLLLPTIAYGIMMLRCKFPVNERVAAGVPYRDMLKEAGALGALIVIFLIAKEVGRVALQLFGESVPWLKGHAFTLFENSQLAMVFSATDCLVYGVIIFLTLVYLLYTRSLGRWMYVFLLLVMILLAITELGTDGWIKELRDPAMQKLGMSGGWILIYTASIMMILRFCIGPIVKLLKPLGVLLVSSLFAAAGLFLLSDAERVVWILVTATIYGMGQTFFWPVTLGVIAERFPKGGALTLNAIAGVGMLGVGIIGGPLLGRIQDTSIEKSLTDKGAEIRTAYIQPEARESVLGDYYALDAGKVKVLNHQVTLFEIRSQVAPAATQAASAPADVVAALGANEEMVGAVQKAYGELVLEGKAMPKPAPSFAQMYAALAEKGLMIDGDTYARAAADAKVVKQAEAVGKQDAMKQIAILPIIMAVCYLGLIIYFRAKGGYKVVELAAGGGESEHTPTVEEQVADEEATPNE